MKRSEAQKAADKRYAKKVKDQYRQFAVNLKADDYEKIVQAIESANMSKADFLRWAVAQLENK